jgi:hypothetical protein
MKPEMVAKLMDYGKDIEKAKQYILDVSKALKERKLYTVELLN